MPKSANPQLRLTKARRALLNLSPEQKDSLDRERVTKTIAFRLTESDHANYMEKVKASGLTQSEFFREVVLMNKTEVIAKPKMSDNTKLLLALVNKCGNNINQLAYRANADHVAGIINKKTYLDILFCLQDISLFMKTGLANDN